MDDPQPGILMKIKKSSSDSQNDVKAHLPVEEHTLCMTLQSFHIPFQEKLVAMAVQHQSRNNVSYSLKKKVN